MQSLQGSKPPKYLVRLCRKLTNFKTLVNEATKCTDGCWSQDLIQRVIKEVLAEKSSGISTYNADICTPFDVGHSLAVIAEGISQKEFLVTSKPRKSSCTRGSLIIPVSCFPKTTRYQFTPENNLNFYPANDRHFDLDIDDSEELAVAILKGIHNKTIGWTILGNEGKSLGSYRLQAGIAYSHCLKTFGELNHSQPPLGWDNGKDLTAGEQIEILQHLAQVAQIDSPIEM
ncbi:hypothetical protein [Nostoc sp. TCL240-02]|uniref:hypothetical protein n=1 Tax=Nostoc sp. TCL240-02 TaxID=2572090 RepID=UPI00157F9D58|nr:hypothetical protein [Nostoc sp. TCL240-02]QKQ75624.1 hypothetical protein FBB35_22110 [Nostoc sp. TCL240-02]